MSYRNPHEDETHESTITYNPYTDDQPAVYNYPPPQTTPPVAPLRRESSGFELGEFPPGTIVPPGSKRQSMGALKEYRDDQANLCTKGGRVRCIGRICCCSLMTTVFLIVSIVLALALWIRPPTITIGSVQPLSGSVGSAISATNGFSIQLGVDISVANPNYFSVDFVEIEAELFYPINNTAVGGGNATNIVFQSHSLTNFTFPFTLSYNGSGSQDAIITDLATKCGVTGGQQSNLVIDYTITLGIRILMATIFPVISNTFSFPCPISASDISKLLSGLNLRNLD